METIYHQVVIKAPAKDIHALLATATGMQQWLKEEDGWKITGDEKVGGRLTFFYKTSHHVMEVIALDRDKAVTWQCTEGPPEWIGTTVHFSIADEKEQQVLHFEHAGWAAKTPFFEECNKAWKGYVSDIKKVAEQHALN